MEKDILSQSRLEVSAGVQLYKAELRLAETRSIISAEEKAQHSVHVPSKEEKLLKTWGLTSLKPTCKISRELCEKVSDNTWLRLCLSLVSQKIKNHVVTQGWPDCESIADCVSSKHLPQKVEACHVFAQSCPNVQPGTADYSALVRFHKLMCLKAYGRDCPEEPMPSPMTPILHQGFFNPMMGGLSPKARSDANEVKEKFSIDPEEKDILWYR